MRDELFSYFRIVNVTLGAWLFVSAFLWPHTTAELANAVLVGAAIIGAGVVGTRMSMIRFVNTALAIWLFASAYVLPAREWGTPANSGMVALAVFIISLLGSYRRTPAPRQT